MSHDDDADRPFAEASIGAAIPWLASVVSMDTRIGVLPHDVLDALSLQLSDPSATGLRVLKLPHPRTGTPSFFIPYALSEFSILEVQAVVSPNARSWFIGEQEVVADGKLLLITPIDPTFLLIPILQSIQPDDGTLGHFRQLDDLVENAVSQLVNHPTTGGDPSLTLSRRDLEHFTSLQCFQHAIPRICDFKEITPEIIVYRFSIPKLLEYLRAKVTRLATPETFDCSKSLIRGLAKQGLMEDGKEELLRLGRIRDSCDLLAQYLPPDIRDALIASYELTPLDDYLKKLEEEAAAARLITETHISKKSTKKTAVKDGPKRKAQSKASQGVEKLAKVDTNGMMKISSFFKKA